MGNTMENDGRLVQVLDRLNSLSIKDRYNPYVDFKWPSALPDDAFWMSTELLSVAGTAVAEELTPAQLKRLSQWESINFYSLNVHGIRELLAQVVRRIHTRAFAVESEFLHHFIGEENEHMWFFATFCRLYGGKLYPEVRLKYDPNPDRAIEDFLVFARILIFEEIVDFYNVTMGKDPSLPPIVRKLNETHHRDESRHVAFGRELLVHMHQKLRRTKDDVAFRHVEDYLRRYIAYTFEQFYSPLAYADAGLADPFGLRQRMLADPARGAFHRTALRKTTAFLKKAKILPDEAAG